MVGERSKGVLLELYLLALKSFWLLLIEYCWVHPRMSCYHEFDEFIDRRGVFEILAVLSNDGGRGRVSDVAISDVGLVYPLMPHATCWEFGNSRVI